jgi:acyl carrier protein phosphodiesterase
MNFLSHIYLADGLNKKILLGNFLGDFVRKADEKHYEKSIQQGIHMHRKLDSFTDSHPVFLRSRGRISDMNRRYSGVLIDMFYDHFLARDWTSYSDIPLNKYAEDFYELLRENQSILPARLLRAMPYIIRDNWLLSYSRISGISQAVNNLARRFESSRRPMHRPVDELINNYKGLEEDFKEFFPQAVKYAKHIAATLL